ncbi:MAG: hypothetical protein JWN22_1252 [Nocardioides sp.]|nr:hypothetical protein [Nocardioides sp.]
MTPQTKTGGHQATDRELFARAVTFAESEDYFSGYGRFRWDRLTPTVRHAKLLKALRVLMPEGS